MAGSSAAGRGDRAAVVEPVRRLVVTGAARPSSRGANGCRTPGGA